MGCQNSHPALAHEAEAGPSCLERAFYCCGSSAPPMATQNLHATQLAEHSIGSMDFGLESPFGRPLETSECEDDPPSVYFRRHEEKIPMPSFYKERQEECRNELEGQSFRATLPAIPAFLKKHSLGALNASSEIDIFNPSPDSFQSTEFRSRPPLSNPAPTRLQFNSNNSSHRLGQPTHRKGSSFHGKGLKSGFNSEPQSGRTTPPLKQINPQDFRQRHQELVRRIDALYPPGLPEIGDQEQQHRSFADIVKALEQVKYVTGNSERVSVCSSPVMETEVSHFAQLVEPYEILHRSMDSPMRRVQRL